MHTVAGFFSSLANGVTYSALAAVLDQSLTVSANNRYIFPGNYRCLAAALMGVNMSAARINAPSLRSVVLPEIYPVNAAAALGDNVKYTVYGRNGPRFIRNEEVTLEVSHGGAGAEDQFGALFVTENFVPAPDGPIFTLLATASPTLTDGTWVNAALTFNQTLPSGEYTVVGMNVVCNDAFLARLVFPGQSQYRPGCVVNDTYGQDNNTQMFRYGRMGLYGKFQSTAQPSVEFLGYAAGAESPIVMLDCIKTG